MSTLFLQFLQNIVTKQKGSPGTAVGHAHKGGRVTCQPTLTPRSLPATQKLCKSMVSKHLKKNAGQPFQRQYISSQNDKKVEDPFHIPQYPQNKTKPATMIIPDYTVPHFEFTHDEHSLTLSVLKLISFRKCYKVTDHQEKTYLLKSQR